MKSWIKITGRVKSHKKIRNKISGTKERPRLSVYRSIDNLYAQLVDDLAGHTMLSLSTSSPDLKEKVKKDGGNVKGASALGVALAEACKDDAVPAAEGARCTDPVVIANGWLPAGK